MEKFEPKIFKIRQGLVKNYGPIGLYAYGVFLKKALEADPNEDLDSFLEGVITPIFERYDFLSKKIDGFLAGGLPLHNALEKIKGPLSSPEDEALSDVIRRRIIVEDGLKNRADLLQKLSPAMEKKFFSVDLEDPLSKFDFFYELFTESGITSPDTMPKEAKSARPLKKGAPARASQFIEEAANELNQPDFKQNRTLN